VAVTDDGACFLPFHREAFNAGVGRPVGAYLSDYHGIICPPDYQFSPVAVVRGAGLSAWEFNHLPASQTAFDRWVKVRAESAQVDLLRWERGSPKLSEENRKRRKLGRDLGPLELEFSSKDPAVFRQLLEWKSDQYVRTGMKDITKDPWVVDVLTDILACDDPAFSGVLTVLRAGGRIVAIHFGMQSDDVLHSWIPAYDVSISQYSGGIILLMNMLDEALDHGVKTFDFGRGAAFYKSRLSNTSVALAEGVVNATPLAGMMRGARKAASALIQKTPLRAPAVAVLNRLRGR
jgi:CelD/BcsL family acetyltransferase involved in cellulose biosynthesis